MGLLTPYWLSAEEWPEGFSEKRESVLERLGRLGTGFLPSVKAELAKSLEVINSYYSNAMEGNPTKIGEVFDAQAGRLAKASTERNFQLEHVAHIQVSVWIRQNLEGHPSMSPVSRSFLKEVHRRFYLALPETMRYATLISGEKIPIEPGEWRRRIVTVGRFQAPPPEQVESCMQEFEEAYDADRLERRDYLCALAAAHHRFLWVHPFGDGNGRVVRLFTEAMTTRLNLDGGQLYSINRGLARRRRDYDECLGQADAPRRGDLDGRGNLTREGLAGFTQFFVDVMEDQVRFMSEILSPQAFQKRTEAFLAAQRATREVSASEADVLRYLSKVGNRRSRTAASGQDRRAAPVPRVHSVRFSERASAAAHQSLSSAGAAPGILSVASKGRFTL